MRIIKFKFFDYYYTDNKPYKKYHINFSRNNIATLLFYDSKYRSKKKRTYDFKYIQRLTFPVLKFI